MQAKRKVVTKCVVLKKQDLFIDLSSFDFWNDGNDYLFSSIGRRPEKYIIWFIKKQLNEFRFGHFSHDLFKLF